MPPSSKSPPHRSLPFLQIRFLPTAWRATWFLRCGQPVRTVDCWQCADDYYSRSMRRQIQCRFPGRATSRTNRATSTTSKNRRSPENKELSQNTSVQFHRTTQHTHTHRRPVYTARHRFQNAPSRLHAARAATTVDRSLHSFFGEANGGRHIKEGRRSAPTLFREVSNVAASFDRLQIGFNLFSFYTLRKSVLVGLRCRTIKVSAAVSKVFHGRQQR